MRIIYFGTWNGPGHFARPICGTFTKNELSIVEEVDTPSIYNAVLERGFAYARFDDFLGYIIPHSVDDKRPGCITAVFVEGAKTSTDIRNAIINHWPLPYKFKNRLPQTDEFQE